MPKGAGCGRYPVVAVSGSQHHRHAHNPKVAGSNPAPATKNQGPVRKDRAFVLSPVGAEKPGVIRPTTRRSLSQLVAASDTSEILVEQSRTDPHRASLRGRPEFVVLGGLVPDLLCSSNAFHHAYHWSSFTATLRWAWSFATVDSHEVD
jgi:hypothetical protein